MFLKLKPRVFQENNLDHFYVSKQNLIELSVIYHNILFYRVSVLVFIDNLKTN